MIRHLRILPFTRCSSSAKYPPASTGPSFPPTRRRIRSPFHVHGATGHTPRPGREDFSCAWMRRGGCSTCAGDAVDHRPATSDGRLRPLRVPGTLRRRFADIHLQSPQCSGHGLRSALCATSPHAKPAACGSGAKAACLPRRDGERATGPRTASGTGDSHAGATRPGACSQDRRDLAYSHTGRTGPGEAGRNVSMISVVIFSWAFTTSGTCYTQS